MARGTLTALDQRGEDQQRAADGSWPGLADLRPLLEEIGDIKRVRSAGRDGSIASRLFATAWADLLGGKATDALARDITTAALCAARLGDLDAALLRDAGVSASAITDILDRAVASVAAPLHPALRDALRGSTAAPLVPPLGASLPGFVRQLQEQPRAGVTCPGTRRIILEPPENHAEHCLIVAVYGVLLSPSFGADPTRVFVAALAHHLHNALLPDSGFTGEMLLGGELDPVMDVATTRALDELPPDVRTLVVDARRILPDAQTAEGRAFHAADAIDRVLQIAQHLQGATLTMRTVLDDMHLVHEGPVKGFHDAVLAQIGLS